MLNSLISILDVGLVQGSIYSLLALSVAITLLSMDFPDLSIEGTFPFGAAVTGVLIVDLALPPTLATGIAFVAGIATGALTGVFHVRLGMSKLLSGIASAAMLYSAGLLIMSGKANIPLLEPTTILSWFERLDMMFNEHMFPNRTLFLHPMTLVLLLAIAAAMAVVVRFFLSSEFGVALRAIGANEPGVEHYGLSSGLFKITGLAFANGLAACGGSLAAQHQGFADVNMGIGVLVSSLVAVILGREILNRFKWSLSQPSRLVIAAILGSYIYQTVLATVLAIGAPPTSIRFLSGAALVLVVGLKKRRREEVVSSW